MGHEVVVVHLMAKYPGLMYWFGRKFQHALNSFLGMLVPVESPKEEVLEQEGFRVYRRNLRKFKPHGRYSKRAIKKAVKIVEKLMEIHGTPDWVVGHWDSPQLEVMYELKSRYGLKTGLVFHNNDFHFGKKYGRDTLKLLSSLDAIGFRNEGALKKYAEIYGEPYKHFLAPSGVSSTFLSEGEQLEKDFSQGVKNFIYIGSLIERKYPLLVLKALTKAYPDGDFRLTYVGDGAQKSVIETFYKESGCKGKIVFTGRIEREAVVEHLKKADVFVMISKREVFGLVYLEAMAMGVIPVGSKGEGIDGIIQDGKNGFLCEPGNLTQLESLLAKLKGMSADSLQSISLQCKKTAEEYSDSRVADNYLNSLQQ